MQGMRKSWDERQMLSGLQVFEPAFPEARFPLGAVHELISYTDEAAAATTGFITGLLGSLTGKQGISLWVSTERTIFPPTLKQFNLDPERVIFIEPPGKKEALWVIEEGLKCKALSAVVGEIAELSFTESRRLQLAVEQSQVTGFIHRRRPRTENTVACTTRWKIQPVTSQGNDSLPGVGFPRWHVQLLKVRNGKPGSWQIEWTHGEFRLAATTAISLSAIKTSKTG